MVNATYYVRVRVNLDQVVVSVTFWPSSGLVIPPFEVVKWVEDEWLEDPTLAPTIANTITMAYECPGRLISMSKEHIKAQMLTRPNLGQGWVDYLYRTFPDA